MCTYFIQTSISNTVKTFIKDCTLSYGKVKLILKHNRYFVESIYHDKLLKDPIILNAKVNSLNDKKPEIKTELDTEKIEEKKKEGNNKLGTIISLKKDIFT